MTTDIAASPAYGLIRPTVADLRACVTEAADGGPQLWAKLCRIAGVDADTDTDDPAVRAVLIAVALQFTTGPVRVSVMSLNIRLRAYTALTTR